MGIRNRYIVFVNKVASDYNLHQNNDYCSYYLPPIRPLFIIKNDGRYLYEFIGRYEKVDEPNRLIYFKCSNNKLYSFKVDTLKLDYQNSTVEVVYNNNEKNNSIVIPIDNTKSLNKYHLLFASNKTLGQILSAHGTNKNAFLNDESEEIILIYNDI